jgi:hypothetical protein
MSSDGRLLLVCDVTAPAPAFSTVPCTYRVYRDIAWQCVDQTRHNIFQHQRATVMIATLHPSSAEVPTGSLRLGILHVGAGRKPTSLRGIIPSP